ncbi:MAG: hypothetical protein JNN30_21190 [Rhodanobacteraceae bacterium]|nr:hypothetical protein [Rhodanobacteraceae bacterium]
MTSTTSPNRPPTDAERRLARYMLEHGEPEGRAFLAQLEAAEVTSWKCPCGCASFNFRIAGHPEAPPGVSVLGDFLCGPENSPSGIFIFESGGLLSGIELYGMASEAPRELPAINELRPLPPPK